MLALDRQRLTHRLHATVDAACLILAAASQQQGVQILQVACRGHGYQMIAPKGPDFAFYATLFMALARRTEACLEIPVGTERHEARRFLAAKAAQDLLHRRAEVVVAQTAKRTPQVVKSQLVGFQERLLRRSQVGSLKCRPTGHAAHREHLDRDRSSSRSTSASYQST